MNGSRILSRLFFAVSLLLIACGKNNNLAGGSSGVDNPEIVVAFTNGSGTSITITGAVRIYAADQNPVLDPDPITQIRLKADSSIKLSRLDFSRDDSGGANTYNVLVTTDDDSLGGLLQNLSYNRSTKKFASMDSQGISKVRLRIENMVRYQASLDLASSINLERVFIPGTPFQAVVVDSGFTFDAIPQGIFPLRLIRNYVEEIPLPESLNTDETKRFHVDTAASPIVRPQPSDPPGLQVTAGGDQTVSILGENVLSGLVSGISDEDPRLAVYWRQISPDLNITRALIDNPSQRETKVAYPSNGLYGFILSASFGMSLQLEDTVWMNVQPMAFVQPVLGDTLRLNTSFNVVWSDPIAHAALSLQLSVDGGSNWSVVATGFSSKAGLNSISWTPAGASSTNCLLRLLDNTQAEKARSGLFVLRTP